MNPFCSGALAVSVGAALGAVLRWQLGSAMNAWLPNLPLGTLTANLVGGYLIGVAVAGLALAPGLAPEIRLFAMTGFLGGLTTFSTFSAEAVALLMRAQYGWALAQVGSHLIGSLIMTGLGIATVRMLKA